MPAMNRRGAAVSALTDITQGGGYNNVVLRKTLGGLPAGHRAFVTEVVNGCLRNLIYIDYALDHISNTPTAKMKPFVRNTLRVGAYQLLFMDRIPPSAACDESVRLVKSRGFTNLAPFVNGVLRNLARGKDALPLPDRQERPREFLSVQYSCPRWLIDYWLSFMDTYAVEEMCRANLRRPRVTVCVNRLRTDGAALARALAQEGVTAEPLPWAEDGLFMTHVPDVTGLAAFEQGLFHVMDAGAMAAVRALDPKPGDTVLDMCAAPGGKSLYAAALMENRGAVYAFDNQPQKLGKIEAAAARLGASIITAREGDAAVFNPELENLADRVIVDAPCSCLGLLRKRPDVKYSKTMEDVESLSGIQRDILANCGRYVKPGGVLVYCTCTVSAVENQENAAWFLENFAFSMENIQEQVVDSRDNVLQLSVPEGAVSLLPQDYEGDGFFIARFRRQA